MVYMQVEKSVFKCTSKVKEAGQMTLVLPYDLPPRPYTREGTIVRLALTDLLLYKTDFGRKTQTEQDIRN